MKPSEAKYSHRRDRHHGLREREGHRRFRLHVRARLHQRARKEVRPDCTFSDPHTAQAEALEKAVEILSDPGAKETWAERRRQMLVDVIDVSDYVVSLVEKRAR